MKKTFLLFLLILAMAIGSSSSLMAQPATEDEALTVATNWISAIIAKKGSWGSSKTAEIEKIEPFNRKDRQVGYFCKVKPGGYIIISPRKEMAPVKAYSATSELDPLSEEGMADLLKGSMERILTKIQETEQQRKGLSGEAAALDDLFEVDYRPSWAALNQKPDSFIADPDAYKAPVDTLSPDQSGAVDEGPDAAGETSNYQEGEVLLSSNWDQFPPYNNDCPYQSCSTSNGRVVVGCVATAGAQLMRYWNWPPYGVGSSTHGGETVYHYDSYDWVNMPDDATTSSPAAEQAAVAELSHEVGVAVEMDYGCSGSGTWTYMMEGVYEDHYRYSTTFGGSGAERKDRSAYNASSWFSMMQTEFNYNRPVQYRITGHSIVGDGWQTVVTTNQYHMNYGWSSTSSDAWYTVDTLTSNPEDEEYLIRYIIPSTYLLKLTGTFARDASFRYRYFYRDTTGGSGTFEGGQFLQFLPGVVAECTSGTVRFENSESWFTRLFTKGDLYRGVFMTNSTGLTAAIKMYSGGGIKFH